MPGAARAWCWLKFAIGLAVALAIAAVAAPAQAGGVPDERLARALDAPTRAWLDAHRQWRVAVVRDAAPIEAIDAAGAYTGVSADVLGALAALAGARVEPVPFDGPDAALKAVRDGQVDVLASIARTPERERTLRFTTPYLRLAMAYIGRRGDSAFTETGNFGGRTVAVERGGAIDELLRTRFPQVRRLEVEGTEQALAAVVEGRADVYRGALLPAHYLIERKLLPGLRVLSSPTPGDIELAFAAAQPQLVAVLDAALHALGPASLADMARRWWPMYVTLAAPGPAAPASAAAAGSAAAGTLRVVFDRSFAPISWQGDDGSAGGLAIEMFRRSAERAQLAYRLIARRNFATAYEDVRRGEADVLVAAVLTQERLADGRFIGPYYTAPSAIVSRLDAGWPSITSLVGKTLVVDEMHYLIPAIRREAPGVKLRIVADTTQVLQTVADGGADAGITNVEVAATHVGRSYVGRLQVSGLVDSQPSALHFMVRNDRADVAQALQAGFDAIPEDERRSLSNAQLRTEIRVGLSWRDVALVVGPVLAGLLGLLGASALSTRRLRAERDRANHAAQARADFVADMSHEVRTPLVALAEGMRLLGQQPLSGAARRVLAPLLASVERLVGLLNTLLDMARLDAGTLEIRPVPLDLAGYVVDVARAFEPMARAKGLALRIEADPALPELMADPQRVQQVVNNLVSNAIKFTERGGVSVELSGRAADARLWEVSLRVRDSGPGMSEEVRRGLFDRFARASEAQRRKGGSGLGLAIVRQLVSHGGGRIHVHSTPGQGSEFTVTLRLQPAEAAALRGPQLHRILLVDDDPVNLLVFAAQLRQRGYEVETAEGFAAAEQRLLHGGFDLVLTDANFGGGERSGAELAARISVLWPGMPVLVLSGDDAPAGFPPGVLGWLNKPRHARDVDWLHAVAAYTRTAPPRGTAGPAGRPQNESRQR